EYSWPNHFLRRRRAIHWRHAAPAALVVWIVAQVPFYKRRTRCKCVHADIERREFDRELFCEPVQACFARRIGDQVLNPEGGTVSGNIYDRASSGFLQPLCRLC